MTTTWRRWLGLRPPRAERQALTAYLREPLPPLTAPLRGAFAATAARARG